MFFAYLLDAKGDAMKNKGIILILLGIGILFISIFFSSGYNSRVDTIENIYHMTIILYEGELILPHPDLPQYTVVDLPANTNSNELFNIGHYEGGVNIPLKYPLSVSLILILFGAGILLLSEKK